MNILIEDPEAREYVKALQPHFPLCRFLASDGIPNEHLQIEEADVLITFGHKFSAMTATRAARLRWVQALSTGTDHLQNALSSRPDTILTSARGVHGRPVAEYVMMMMMALSRKLPAAIEAQRERNWNRRFGALIAGKTIAIAGLGVIGQAIAKRCRAFEMKVIGLGSVLRDSDDVDSFYTYNEMSWAVRDVDFLVIVTPLSDTTRGMFNRAIFDAMPSSAFVINVGRGATVVEEDLLAALQAGSIAGAALDAFVDEPLPAESLLWQAPNTIVTPHIAGAHRDYLESVVAIIRHNLGAFIEGRSADMINRVPRSGSLL